MKIFSLVLSSEFHAFRQSWSILLVKYKLFSYGNSNNTVIQIQVTYPFSVGFTSRLYLYLHLLVNSIFSFSRSWFGFYLGICNKTKWFASFLTTWQYNPAGIIGTGFISITNLDLIKNTLTEKVEQTHGTPVFSLTGSIKDDCTGLIDLPPYRPVAPFKFDSTNCKHAFVYTAYRGTRLPGRLCINRHLFCRGTILPIKLCINRHLFCSGQFWNLNVIAHWNVFYHSQRKHRQTL